jgi:hypothetical protein
MASVDDGGSCIGPKCPNKSDTLIKGYTAKDFEKAHQYQGPNSTFCGATTLAMAKTLATGKNTSLADTEEFLERNNKIEIFGGVRGNPLASGTQLFLQGNQVSYQKNGTIEQLKKNVDDGYLTMVGISNQTNKEILSNTSEATVGHWMLVVGYNDYSNDLILMDPAQNTGDWNYKQNYFEFSHVWKDLPNFAIGFGEMITIK